MTDPRTPRREFLASALAAGAALPLLGGTHVSAQEKREVLPSGALGLPGPWPGRVVEVRHPGMIRDGVKHREPIRKAVGRGLCELTGADDVVEAWRAFVEPGDVVGIKMNPVGNPFANSSNELMLEVIDGLRAAGVKDRDIIVFERYRSEFIGANMHKAVPDGIAWTGLTAWNDPSQLQLKGPASADPLSGYDPDEYVTMELVGRGQAPKDDRTRRSHLGLLVTRRVSKLILLPVLKDHGSAGVTGALKNMSHGLVNNVERSHSAPDLNVCNQFIPEVVSHPIIREKCVLQILDGIRGVFQKGPHATSEKFVWDYNGLFFATDPVALDRVEWDIIDAKRKKENLPPVAATGKAALDPLGTEFFDVRQPQHIALCGTLGLGESDRKKIDHRVVKLT
jgi:uncharacterized protein (DUF362 family)